MSTFALSKLGINVKRIKFPKIPWIAIIVILLSHLAINYSNHILSLANVKPNWGLAITHLVLLMGSGVWAILEIKYFQIKNNLYPLKKYTYLQIIVLCLFIVFLGDAIDSKSSLWFIKPVLSTCTSLLVFFKFSEN